MSIDPFFVGLDKEGIFRKSPSSEELQSVKAAFNNGTKSLKPKSYTIVTQSLLKQFFFTFYRN